MKRNIIWLVMSYSMAVTLLLVSCAPPAVEKEEAPSLTIAIDKVMPAVVRVITRSGTGSGMIVDKAGYVLTNNHVVEGEQTATIELADGRQLPASIHGRSEIEDLAILKIDGNNLPLVVLGDSDKLELTEEVIAIGYPLDLKGSATISKGIVSAFRTFGGVDYIQTDTSINPGNSGGPLINLEGEVVGINVLTIRVVDELPIEGMNFAIAIDSVKPIILKLIAGGAILAPTSSVSPAPAPAPIPEPSPLPPPKPEILTYTNAEHGFSLDYPGKWEYQEGVLNTIVIFLGPYIEKDDSFVNIFVVSEELLTYPKWELEDYFKLNELKLRKQLDNYEKVEERDVTIADRPAKVLTYMADYNGRRLMTTLACFMKGKIAYSIFYEAPTEVYNEHVNHFDLATNTFEFD